MFGRDGTILVFKRLALKVKLSFFFLITLFAHLAGFSNFNLCFNKTKKVSFTFSITQTIIAVAKTENTKDLKKQWQFDIILLNSSFLKNYILMFYFHATVYL